MQNKKNPTSIHHNFLSQLYSCETKGACQMFIFNNRSKKSIFIPHQTLLGSFLIPVLV